LTAAIFENLLNMLQFMPGTRKSEISLYTAATIGHERFEGHQIVHCQPFKGRRPQMDYVFFIPPPQFVSGKQSRFRPSIEECWYRRVVLLFCFRILTENDETVECDCAKLDVLSTYVPGNTHIGPRGGWRQVGDGGTKLLYQCSPEPVLYVVPVSSILGRLALVPAWDHGTIPRSVAQHKSRRFLMGRCDGQDRPGTGSKLFYINTWAMQWASDHPISKE
jgi:hypothetical protein